jgi:CheY-like chemotaxis protein
MPQGVLIVDDHAPYRATAREALERQGMTVVGEAGDGDDAVARATALAPAIVLLDVHLPGADGFRVAERLGRLPGPPAVILISSRLVGDLDARMRASGAAGFIAKEHLSRSAIEVLLG